MTRITVIGGTGYAGAAIVREAAARGHQVTAVSRNAPADPVEGVRYVQAEMTDDAARRAAVTGADVVIGALSPRGELVEGLGAVYARLTEQTAEAGARLGVIGGFSSLRVAPGGIRIAFTDQMPPEYAAEGRAMADVAESLLTAPAELDWFYASPAMEYGAHVPGTATGTFRIGADLPLFDDNGRSAISGPDFGTAIVDEIENPKHHRAQFTVAY